MSITDSKPLNRGQIKAAFRRNRGAASQLARELAISPQNIYDWLKGVGRSARVETAIRQRAEELVERGRAA